jgi:NAD(P)H dehydrogenase (quinone)
MVADSPLFLVTASTGKTGSQVVRELVARQARVRAFVHQIDARSDALAKIGVEVLAGDLLDVNAVRQATRGVSGVYFCYPPEDRLLEATTLFALSAKDSGVPAVVNLSQYHAREGHPSALTRQHWLAERVLDSSNIGARHLRANFFMEVYSLVCRESITNMNKIFLPHGNGAVASVSTRDIGRVVAEILMHPERHPDSIIKLTGPDSYTQSEAARVFSSVLNRHIEYIDMPSELWRAVGEQQGLSPFLLDHLCRAADDVKAGNFAEPTSEVMRITSEAPITLEKFVAANSKVWRLGDA